jgi:hypothetical protein
MNSAPLLLECAAIQFKNVVHLELIYHMVNSELEFQSVGA